MNNNNRPSIPNNKGFGSSLCQPASIAIDSPPNRIRSTKKNVSNPASSSTKGKQNKKIRVWPYLLLLLIIFVGAVLAGGYYEIQTSTLQARFISKFAAKLRYRLADGPSDKIVFPTKGPYDTRLGYVQLPFLVDKLQQKGMVVSRQVRFNRKSAQLCKNGLLYSL